MRNRNENIERKDMNELLGSCLLIMYYSGLVYILIKIVLGHKRDREKNEKKEKEKDQDYLYT